MVDNDVIELISTHQSSQFPFLMGSPDYPLQSTIAERDTPRLSQHTSRSQTACLPLEHSQRLQALIRPLLPHTTWREANKMARRNGHTLPVETREMTILRLDIAGFTNLMDTHPLDQVLTTLDAYFTQLTNIIYDHNGDIDKYLGDGFLAIFAQADEAVHAGCALQQAITAFNREQAAQDGLIFPARIGLDSGPVALTTLGSPDRQERTILGMPVNVAERLQAQATPGRVWLSQATFDLLSDQAVCRYLGPLAVKGRAEPVVVYEIVHFNSSCN